MLKELSPGQLAELGPHADRWLQIGLSTDPLNRTLAQGAIESAYDCAGLKPPAKFIWCSNPVTMDLAYRVVGGVAVRNSIDTELVHSVRYGLECKDVVSNKIHNQISDATGSVVTTVREVWDTVWSLVWDITNGLEEFFLESTWAGVSDSLWEAGLGACWDNNNLIGGPSRADSWCFGSHSDQWLIYNSFLRDHCGLVAETAKLEGLIATAQHCGWWLPCEDKVFVSSKPSRIDLDQEVVTYADGLECQR